MHTSITATQADKARQTARQRVANRLLPKKIFLLLAETFQALGDSSRIQIVWALSLGEMCVNDLAEALSMTQPTVSHHLQRLRILKLVKVRREGRTSYYSLDDAHIERLLREGIEHVQDFA